jgi:hypothetical protein
MTLPIQITNVIKVIQDHLPEELKAVEQKIDDLEAEVASLNRYRDSLLNIQDAVKGEGDYE